MAIRLLCSEAEVEKVEAGEHDDSVMAIPLCSEAELENVD